MVTNVLILALAVAVLQAVGPTDPCRLLTPAEVQALTPNVKIGTGVSKTMPLGSVSCDYEWGPGGNVQSGKSFFHIIVSDASKIFVGMSPAMVKQGLRAEVKKGASEIPGVGDAAIFQSNDPDPS